MKEVKDPRELDYFDMIYTNNGIYRITVREGYGASFGYTISPTSNCQLASAEAFCNIMHHLNKYKIRDLFIKIRKNNLNTKRILLLDLNRVFAEQVVNWLAPGCIIGNMPYVSTNGSKMNIILVKLSLVRQLKLPKQ